jgi:hypothetical protein
MNTFDESPNLSIKDFLQQMEFITPNGYNIDFFVTPETSQEVEDRAPEGFDDNFKITSETPENTIVYTKKDLADAQANYTNNASPTDFIAGKLPRDTDKIGKTIDDPIFTQGGKIKSQEKAFVKEDSPEVEILSEASLEKVFKLNSDYEWFKEGTIFGCSKQPKKLNS